MIKSVITLLCGLLFVTSLTTATHATSENKELKFVDIDHSYAKDSIYRLVDQGIVQGVDHEHFNPKWKLTRAEFTVMLVRSLKLPLNDSDRLSTEFGDVHGWVAPYINAALKELEKGDLTRRDNLRENRQLSFCFQHFSTGIPILFL